MSKSILHLDLHPIAKNKTAIETALENALTTAHAKKLHSIEIIPGKGSGQLMIRVKKFLSRSTNKQRYKRIKIDPNNHGRIFVYL